VAAVHDGPPEGLGDLLAGHARQERRLRRRPIGPGGRGGGARGSHPAITALPSPSRPTPPSLLKTVANPATRRTEKGRCQVSTAAAVRGRVATPKVGRERGAGAACCPRPVQRGLPHDQSVARRGCACACGGPRAPGRNRRCGRRPPSSAPHTRRQASTLPPRVSRRRMDGDGGMGMGRGCPHRGMLRGGGVCRRMGEGCGYQTEGGRHFGRHSKNILKNTLGSSEFGRFFSKMRKKGAPGGRQSRTFPHRQRGRPGGMVADGSTAGRVVAPAGGISPLRGARGLGILEAVGLRPPAVQKPALQVRQLRPAAGGGGGGGHWANRGAKKGEVIKIQNREY